MLRKYLGTLLLLVCMLVTSFTLVACDSDDSDDEVDPGALPVLKMGDTWTTSGSMEGYEVTISLTVTGEDEVDGKAVYVLEGTINPAIEGMVDTIVLKMDKSSMRALQMQMTSESMPDQFETTTTATYEITGAPNYPKKIGNETTVTETDTTVSKIMGQDETETETTTSVYKIEAIEDITVPAGTFSCFKEVEYDDAGTILNTNWQSADVKHFTVKSLDGETGDVMEMVSYSVTP